MRCGQGAVRVQSVRLSASPYGLPVFSGHFAPRGARQERRAADAGDARVCGTASARCVSVCVEARLCFCSKCISFQPEHAHTLAPVHLASLKAAASDDPIHCHVVLCRSACLTALLASPAVERAWVGREGLLERAAPLGGVFRQPALARALGR